MESVFSSCTSLFFSLSLSLFLFCMFEVHFLCVSQCWTFILEHRIFLNKMFFILFVLFLSSLFVYFFFFLLCFRFECFIVVLRVVGGVWPWTLYTSWLENIFKCGTRSNIEDEDRGRGRERERERERESGVLSLLFLNYSLNSWTLQPSLSLSLIRNACFVKTNNNSSVIIPLVTFPFTGFPSRECVFHVLSSSMHFYRFFQASSSSFTSLEFSCVPVTINKYCFNKHCFHAQTFLCRLLLLHKQTNINFFLHLSSLFYLQISKTDLNLLGILQRFSPLVKLNLVWKKCLKIHFFVSFFWNSFTKFTLKVMKIVSKFWITRKNEKFYGKFEKIFLKILEKFPVWHRKF